MKNFIKGRWFPLIVAIVVVAVVAFIMALFGWRITYAPELETSWDAISAFAAWAGAIGTVGAIFAAIDVAHRQNKIVLFEKRYSVYKILKDCRSFAHQIKTREIDDSKEIQLLFVAVFDRNNIFDEFMCGSLPHIKSNLFYESMAVRSFQQILGILEESIFLFKQETIVVEYMNKIIEDLVLVLRSEDKMDKFIFLKRKESFISTMEKPLFDEIVMKMEQLLQL